MITRDKHCTLIATMRPQDAVIAKYLRTARLRTLWLFFCRNKGDGSSGALKRHAQLLLMQRFLLSTR